MQIGFLQEPHRLKFDGSSVFSVKIDNQRPVPPHRHSFYEITIVIDGTGIHESGGISVKVKPLDVFIVPVGTVHQWSATKDLSILNIYYSPAHFLFPIESLGPSSLYAMLFFASEFFADEALLAATHFPVAKTTLKRVVNECSEAEIFKKMNDRLMSPDSKDGLLSDIHFSESQRLFNEGTLLKIIASLSSDYLTNRTPSASGKRLHPSVYRMAEVLDKSAMTGSAPEISTQAATLGISPEYMTRLFTDGVGLSPLKFFNKRRLNYARREVLHNYLSITQIAHRFGFSDAAHFSNSFKEHFGLTPSECRQEKRAEK